MSSVAKSQGAQANLTGSRLERFIEQLLVDCGYARIKDKKALVNSPESFALPSYAKQARIGETIYDTDLIADFFIYHPEKWSEGLVIEAKWQQTSGTVDEKYPYFVMNIWASEYQTVIVLDGGGYRPGAEKWVRSMQRRNLRHVFNMMEFQTWVNQSNI